MDADSITYTVYERREGTTVEIFDHDNTGDEVVIPIQTLLNIIDKEFPSANYTLLTIRAGLFRYDDDSPCVLIESDTTDRVGGLMSRVASKAIINHQACC